VGDFDLPALLAGFVANDAALSAAFIAELMPFVRARLKSRWKSLRHMHDEILDKCLSTLIEWRASGLLRAGEPFRDLASRLVNQSVEDVQRAEDNRDRIAVATAALPPDETGDPERSVISDELRQLVWGLQDKLGPPHQRVLEAYAQAEKEDRSIAEILGVSEEAGRQMSRRARVALAKLIREAGLTAADFLETRGTHDA
jgi:RNA polymerase sigma factor (sigma-70 family)